MMNGIRDNIISSLKIKSPDMLAKVNLELDILEVTEGIDGKNNLESFYNIWQENKDKVGDRNVINSWTAFALGMTTAEPSGVFLPERRVFARAGFPDIDSDFDYFRREEIYSYVIDKYGRENVSNIGTYQGLKLRSAVRRIGKALDIAGSFLKGKEAYITDNEKKVTEIIKSLPFQMGAKLKAKDEEGDLQVVGSIEDAYNLCKDFRFYMDKYPGIRKHAKNIEGVLSIFGCLAKDTPVLTQKGWVRIDQLDKSCKIAYINFDGKVKYSNKFISFRSGEKKCYRLRLIDGNFIDVTDEHLILTDKGYVLFENIRKNPKNYKVCSLKKTNI